MLGSPREPMGPVACAHGMDSTPSPQGWVGTVSPICDQGHKHLGLLGQTEE